MRLAGCLILPPVSVPSAIGTICAATAAADPPLLPPGTLSNAHGFEAGFIDEFSFDDPIANSSMFAFPIMGTPAFLSLFTTVASYTPS